MNRVQSKKTSYDTHPGKILSQDMRRASLDRPRNIHWQGEGIATNEEMHTMGAEYLDVVHTSNAQEPLHRRTALVVVRSLPVISYACA